MGILKRMNSIIKSNVNDLLDKVTDPAKEIEQLIEDMGQAVKEAQREAVTVTAALKQAERRRDELAAEAAQWYRRAEQAVRAGDDALARQALGERTRIEEQRADAARHCEEERARTDELQNGLKELDRRLQDLKSRKESLKQRARAAKDGSPAVSGGKAFQDFERMESRIEALETEAQLTDELDGKSAQTAAKFVALEEQQGNPEVEDALAELKRKMERGEG